MHQAARLQRGGVRGVADQVAVVGVDRGGARYERKLTAGHALRQLDDVHYATAFLRDQVHLDHRGREDADAVPARCVLWAACLHALVFTAHTERVMCGWNGRRQE